ncbi:hypothetical protein LAZ67_3003835 [Cordylochernes scorpioides]|uniref:Reverse transcriptase RNase H-like domain-containing protein n=1 Tax=Cordylochernes scorpioides TaxID=51811 RepID=A0ABY6KA74_9ARAC|nr:hypothetical protein LAZ67_3003835 [Cordylochernes scorpioides]
MFTVEGVRGQGVFKQVYPDGKTYTVQNFSRALRAHERNYSISELQCLAIVESVDNFRVCLMDRKFAMFSDHPALQWLKEIKNPSDRLFRWRLRLSRYEYEVRSINGVQQYETDVITRNPFCGFLDASLIKSHQPSPSGNSSLTIDHNGLHTVSRNGVKLLIYHVVSDAQKQTPSIHRVALNVDVCDVRVGYQTSLVHGSQPPENDSDRREQQADVTNFEAGASSEPHLLTQGDLNELGLVNNEFVPEGQIINQNYYIDVLRRLREAVRQKPPEKWHQKNSLLHHYNARQNTAVTLQLYLAKHGITLLPQPPYSPELAPNDFLFYPKIKKGRRFDSIPEMKENTMNSLKSLKDEDFQRCFDI